MRTDDENVGPIEAHRAVFLYHSERHQLNVRQLRAEGRQLLAQDVPAIAVVMAVRGKAGDNQTVLHWHGLRKQEAVNVLYSTAPEVLRKIAHKATYTRNATQSIIANAFWTTHMNLLERKASASKLMK